VAIVEMESLKEGGFLLILNICDGKLNFLANLKGIWQSISFQVYIVFSQGGVLAT
jgi:hypothetical protein